MRISQIEPRAGTQAFFRFRRVGDAYLVTNFEGNWLILSADELKHYLEGTVPAGSALETKLDEKNFLSATYDVTAAIERMRARHYFLRSGPNLHLMIVTLRCNETCVYCHASRANLETPNVDMTPETAEKAVDLVFESTSPCVTIEFQGGEPLVNFATVKHIIEHARRRNATAGKQLEFTMVSNLALMDEEKFEYLMDNKVQICTSIDGPEALHNAQRKLPTQDAHQRAVRWIRRINQAYVDRGLDPSLYHVEALLTTTKSTLGLAKEVVDTYVDLGFKTIFLRPVDPFGFAERTRLLVEYPRSAYLDFYREAVDYMIELNRQGVEILERYAAIFLTKILRGTDPNYLDARSPAGAGIGALAYNYDGRVFTCDEGRMLYEMGKGLFQIGQVGETKYRDLVGSETVRAMTLATNLEGQPDCATCAYKPYCGTNSAYNYNTQGTVFGRMPDNAVCQVHKGIQDYLFEKLAKGDPEIMGIFDRWTTFRPRDHFVQERG